MPFIRCWGESNVEKSKDQLKKVAAFCSQSEEIFLSQRFSTGRIEMQFEWLHGADLHPLQFFTRYAAEYRVVPTPDNQASKEDVTPFECQHQVVQQQNGQRAKTIFCVRAYRQFDGLYDALYLAASFGSSAAGHCQSFHLVWCESGQCSGL